MADKAHIYVEVAYALPDKQQIIRVQVAADCTLLQAVEQSGICQQFPDLDLDQATFGVFGQVLGNPQTATLNDGDRVEIYRPLIADPKEVRKQRAAKLKEAKAK